MNFLPPKIDLRAVMQQSVATHPDKIALYFEDNALSYQQLDTLSSQLAAFWLAEGFYQQRIVCLLPNAIPICFCFLAALKANVTLVPLNFRLKAPEIKMILEDVDASALIIDSQFLETFLQSDFKIRTFVVTETDTSYENFNAYQKLQHPLKEVEKKWQDIIAIFYTSGTTGKPKGVMHTYYSLSWCASMVQQAFPVHSDSMMALFNPMCHTGEPTMRFIPTVCVGGTCVLAKAFDIPAWIKVLKQYPVTIFFSRGTFLQILLERDDLKADDFAHMQTLFVGADKCAYEVYTNFKKRFAVEIGMGFGCTEALMLFLDKTSKVKIGSIGKPLDHVQTKFVENELWVKTPQMMLGYWRKPDITAEVLQDGWYSTGDVMRVDDEGDYWFMGRCKHIIVYNGSNIHPQEVEHALHEIDVIKAAIVVPQENKQHGQIPVAFIVSDTNIEPKSITDFLKTCLADYKIPQHFYFIDAIPMTSMGKQDRAALTKIANIK